MKNVLIIASMLSVLLIVGCTTSSAAPAQNTPTPSAQQPAATPPAATPPAATPPAATPPVAANANAGTGISAGTNADAKTAFTSAFSGNVQYKVDYDVTTTASGQTMKAQMSQYLSVQSASDYKMRMDSSFQGMETRIYLLGGTVTSCSQLSTTWNCIKSTTQIQNPRAQAQATTNDATSVVTRDGTMSVAGVNAACFLAKTSKGSARYCIYDNVPLYIQTMDASGAQLTEMKASSYSKTVSDSDFTLPATASAAGGAGSYGGYQIPAGYQMPK